MWNKITEVKTKSPFVNLGLKFDDPREALDCIVEEFGILDDMNRLFYGKHIVVLHCQKCGKTKTIITDI